MYNCTMASSTCGFISWSASPYTNVLHSSHPVCFQPFSKHDPIIAVDLSFKHPKHVLFLLQLSSFDITYNAFRKSVSNVLSQEMSYAPERPNVIIARFRNCNHVPLERYIRLYYYYIVILGLTDCQQ